MVKSIKAHENFIKDSLKDLDSLESAEKLYLYHTKMVANFQMERLIHLIVTMFVSLFMLASIILAMTFPGLLFKIVSLLLITLLFPYYFHYYQLENGVQNLYKLDKLIFKKMEDLE